MAEPILNADAIILAALPGTCPEIVAATGFALGTVQRAMTRGMTDGTVHIASRILAKAQGRSIRCYARGPGENAPPLFKDPDRPRPPPRAKREVLHSFNLAPLPLRSRVSGAVMAQNRAFALAGVWA